MRELASTRELFANEMQLLDEAACEFAKYYPEQAQMLNLNTPNDRDPYIERLLEGMAFLTAQLRQRIDDDVPEICETLLRQTFPTGLTPIPSCFITQFKTDAGMLQADCIIPNATQIEAQSIAIDCKFKTIASLNLMPLVAIEAHFREDTVTKLFLSMEVDKDINLQQFDLSAISIYLNAARNISLPLYMYFANNFTNGTVSLELEDGSKINDFAKVLKVSTPYLNTENSIFKPIMNGNNSLHVLLEYFAFRDKFLFVDFNCNYPKEFPTNVAKLNFELEFDSILPVLNINSSMFLLNCVPVVNLWQTSAESIKMDHTRFEYPIKVRDSKNNDVYLHEVDEVIGMSESGKRDSYEPIHHFLHKRYNKKFYSLTSKNLGGLYPMTYISFGGNQDYESERISTKVSVTNGHIPRELFYERGLYAKSSRLPNFVHATNITRPTPIYYPPRDSEYRWTLLTHLYLNSASLSVKDNLIALLAIYDWTEKVDNEYRRDSILAIDSNVSTYIKRNTMLKKVNYTITVDEEKFATSADIYLFGSVLHEILSHFVSINYSIDTKIISHPSQVTMMYSIDKGGKQPI